MPINFTLRDIDRIERHISRFLYDQSIVRLRYHQNLIDDPELAMSLAEENPHMPASLIRLRCLSAARDERRHRITERAPASDATSQEDKDHAALQVAKLTRNVSLEERFLLFLRFWADMTHRQIGECLGIAEGNVRIRLHRLLAGLRKVAA